MVLVCYAFLYLGGNGMSHCFYKDVVHGLETHMCTSVRGLPDNLYFEDDVDVRIDLLT